ncbi:MAG: phosphodiester glycosidase family protein [Acidobacteria bacterium]|nr:MAG: phosphodiester glycosidase family protein [Acidobacteriota bacterium]
MTLVDPKLPTSLGPSRGPRFFLPSIVLRLRVGLLAMVAALALLAVWLHGQGLPGEPERVAEGVRLHRLENPALLSPAGPVAVQLLELDPSRVQLELALAEDQTPAKETVVEMVRRRKALAGVNAGFFVVATGAPAGVLKVSGRVVGTSERLRGAVGVRPASDTQPVRLVFDQVALVKHPSRANEFQTRRRFGTSARQWNASRHVVGGAGLLRRGGRSLRPADWVPEQMRDGFTTERHPRTMIGVGAKGTIWLITVDGRNPAISLGMTFAELQRLAERVGLRDALNLDGGGSTTMVVRGKVVNHPSDPTGPRAVSDALLVFPR